MVPPPSYEDDETDDAMVWRHVAATVRPLPGRMKPVTRPAPGHRTQRAVTETLPAADRPASGPADLDGRMADRLRRGLLPVDGRLDLHGLTQEAAQRRLLDFIRRGYAGRRRCLLVITGKGEEKSDGPWYAPVKGILRARLPDWLAAPEVAPLILRVQPAARRHGGEGAFYVLLRRRRE